MIIQRGNGFPDDSMRDTSKSSDVSTTDFTVIIPAFNEEDTIGEVIQKLCNLGFAQIRVVDNAEFLGNFSHPIWLRPMEFGAIGIAVAIHFISSHYRRINRT